MNSAETLDYITGLRRKYSFMDWPVIVRQFNRCNPSTFHQGAFIFADGSIWWAR